MALTDAQRRAAPGVGRPWMRGKSPDSNLGQLWRAASGNTLSLVLGVVVAGPYCVDAVETYTSGDVSHGLYTAGDASEALYVSGDESQATYVAGDESAGTYVAGDEDQATCT